MSKTKNSNWPLYKKILKYIGRYKILLLISLIMAAINSVLALYLPVLIGKGVDTIIGKGEVDFTALFKVIKTMGIIIFISALSGWIMNALNNRVTFDVVRDIRKEAFNKLQRMPLSYIDSSPKGDIVSRIIADIDQIADGLLLGFTQLFTGIITIFGTLLFMLFIEARIALLVVVVTPLSILVSSFIARKTHKHFIKQSEAKGKQTALINEYVGNEKVLIAFRHEDEAVEDFDNVNEELKHISFKATFYSSLTNPSTRFVNNLVYALVALTGGLCCVKGLMTVGQLTSFLSYANQYTKPFNEISSVITELQNSVACAGRVFEIIDQDEQVPDNKDAYVLEDARGSILIKNMSFAYSEDKPLIENFNLDVKPGQRVAIVGPTGCGKTTFINLLMRFYDPVEGDIIIDGKPSSNITRKSLRLSFGMVLQDTWLRRGTVRDNITLGREGITDEEVIEAAKKARAHSFIKRLENGYDTVLGEDGGILSQGQKQLICIARVMLRIPPMLILDEATSSIDTRTEIKIQEAFQTLMEGRTSFIVAHRLSTIRSADVILVMKDGHIIESGKHKKLLADGGFYTNLYNSQFS